MTLLTQTWANVLLPDQAEARELGVRLARGEERAFELVVEQYAPRVRALAARLLAWGDGADDVAQDVFVMVLRKRQTFRGDASLWTWLATITVNRCRSVRRKLWVQQRVLAGVAWLRPRESTTSDKIEHDEQATAVRAAVAELPATYREAIVLRYLEELGTEEIAAVLGIKRNAVEARLSRGRKLLAESLGERFDEER